VIVFRATDDEISEELMSDTISNVRFVSNGQGTRLNVLGDSQRILLTAEDTAGNYALVENYNSPGVSIPLHLHRNEDETFYVVTGEVDFQINGEIVRASAGTTVYLPRNAPHSFTVVGSEPAKMLMMLMPAGLEKYFEELSRLPSDEPPDMEKVFEISTRYGIEFLSPPGNAPAI
jgi:quercetin dioxygenase-like cupin family protein